MNYLVKLKDWQPGEVTEWRAIEPDDLGGEWKRSLQEMLNGVKASTSLPIIAIEIRVEARVQVVIGTVAP